MKKRTFAWAVGLGILTLVIYSSFTNFEWSQKTDESSQSIPIDVTASITIGDHYKEKEVHLKENTSALQIMQILNTEDPELRLVTKEYSGLGTLVESMFGLTNGSENKFWQYKVNDVMPQIGADKLIIHNGDVITWFFAESEF
jgi:hypothetical protein